MDGTATDRHRRRHVAWSSAPGPPVPFGGGDADPPLRPGGDRP